MTIQSEVEVKQVRIVQGTGEQISKAKSSGEILDTDLVIQTDAPELQEKIDDLDTIRSNANLGAVASSELPAVRQTAETAESIARGKARSQVFDTKTAMETWLKSADHKGELSVGDNIYIKAKDTPDYWISEVLTTKDPVTQYWYKISELEAEKPDISNMVTTDTQQTISGNKNFTGTLQKSGVNVATTTNVSTAVSNHNNDANAHDGIKQDVSNLQAKVEQIELFKFPNAIIRGTPTIQNGQISDFSTASYLQFPFLIDFQDNAFQIDFCFTTSTNVQTQQNIIDSNFGIALAIKDGKGLMAISSNGTGWNIGSAVGTIAIQANTTYYARLLWNKLQYKTMLSTDGASYTQDMVLTGATRPYPRTAFIGGCNQEETGHTPHPFLGTINMNKAFLYINNQLIWQGMDDAGLSTRADVSLNNLDAEGEARFTAKQDVISDLATIRTGAGLGATALQSINSSMVTNALGFTPANSTDLTTHTGNGTIHVTASDKVAWSNKMNNPSGGTIGQVLTKTAFGEEWANAKGGLTNESTTPYLSLQILPTSSSDKGSNFTTVLQGTNKGSASGNVCIGYGSSVGRGDGVGSYSVAVGQSSKAEHNNCVAIGSSASCTKTNSTAIGSLAITEADYSIQIGRGTNSEDKSLYVGLDATHNYKLLGSDGKIPEDRLPQMSSAEYDATNKRIKF